MKFRQIVGLVLLASLACSTYSCTVVSSQGDFFGSTTPPARNIFRYVTGDEPASLDPAISEGPTRSANLHGAVRRSG